jgi:hypothetical protein
MTGHRSILLVVLLASAAFPPAGAQTVKGQRIDSLAGVAVTGGFVVLLDAGNQEVARTLVGSGGRFSVHAPGPGTYRLKSERIGYRASVSARLELAAGQSLEYIFRVTPIPVRLAAIEVRDERSCRNRPAEDAATALVWEEVRKALAAASWTARQPDYHVRVLIYERDLDANRHLMHGEQIRSKSGRMERNPFSSFPADQLAAHGFIVERGNEMWYYGPDAQVLLDEHFLDTHCFRLVRGQKDRDGLIGLAFEPTPDRSVPDVDGTLWLDLQSAELRLLEYRYTNLPYDLQDDRVGGTVNFHQIPSGMWIVQRWQIRTPTITSREGFDPLAGRRSVTRLLGFHDTGGEVFEISSRGAIPIFRAPMAGVVGSVRDSATGRPLGGARLTLDGTEFVTFTDSGGSFDLLVPLSGDYEITVAHPAIDSAGLRELRHPVALQRGATQLIEFRVPRRAQR